MEAIVIEPGATWTTCRAYTQRDFDRFAALSGDDNPIHVDPAFAARTRFGRTVAHGMLLYSTICAALTEALGPGVRQHAHELMFVSPTYTGEEVAVRLEVTSVEDGVADIATTITRPGGEIACQGRTLVTLPGAADAPQAAGSAVAVRERSDTAVQHRSLTLGQVAETSRTFSAADLQEYRALAGDTNPLYSDAEYAQARGWPAPRVPGGLLGGLFSYLLGTRLPGRGTNWLKQRLEYPAPCFAGDLITARVTVTRLRPEKDLVNLQGVCMARGQIVCAGESLVLVKDLEHG
jgi:acyl dehydratase